MGKAMLLLGVLGLASLQTWGHGDEKAGPHGGFIKMPGAFHTELVLDGSNKVKVYLLDFEWKNPSVKESSVALTLHGRGRVKSTCRKAEDHFSCRFPPVVDLAKKGTLVLETQREKQKGQSVRYDLPLTLVSGAVGRGQHH